MLTVDQLFTPLTRDEVLAGLLSIASDLGLDVTAWQDGQPGREQLFIVSQKISDSLAIVQTMNKGGLLDYAASVTPEGGPGWLDILALSQYRVTRNPATYARTPVVFTCSGASGNTYAPGSVHLSAGAVTYTNAEQLAIVANGQVTVEVVADVAGAASTAGAGAINQIVSPSLFGVTCSNPGAAIGDDAETNANLVSRCRSKMASLSSQGPSAAYDYAARTINGDNQVQVSSGPLKQPVAPATRTATVTTSGRVDVYVASAQGAYNTPPNYTNQLRKAIEDTTNASPIVVHLTAHGYVTGDQIFIRDHVGNVAANGAWTIIVTDADHFSLDGSAGSGVGASSGTAYRYSDLDLIDKSVQGNANPGAVTCVTHTANGNNPTIVGVITVGAAAASFTDAQIVAKAISALQAFASGTPLCDGTPSTTTIHLEEIRATIFAANAGTKNVVLSSPPGDVSLVSGDVFEVAPTVPTFTVVRV